MEIAYDSLTLQILLSEYIIGIFLENTKLTNLAIHERSRLGISYLPQRTSIFRGLTLYENLLGIAQITKKSVDAQPSVPNTSVDHI